MSGSNNAQRPSASRPTLPVAVLAGERPGGSALAQHFKQPSSVLVELAGATPLQWSLQALQQSERVQGGWLLGPDQALLAAHVGASDAAAQLGLQWRAPKSGPAESLLSLCHSVSARPLLVTTADHALLTPEIVDYFVNSGQAQDADLLIGLVPYSLVADRWPDSLRTRIRLREGDFCGANLFLLKHAAADNAIALWRGFQSERKRPWRLARKLGVTTLARYLFRRLSATVLANRFSLLSDCRVSFVALPYARAAVDVDTLADWHLAQNELRPKQAPP